MPDNVVPIQSATRTRKRVEKAGLEHKFSWHKHLTLDHTLTLVQVRLAGRLFDVSEADGGNIFISRETLAKDLNVHLNTIANNLVKLEKLGWIVCEQRGGPGNGHKGLNNRYRLSIPASKLLR